MIINETNVHGAFREMRNILGDDTMLNALELALSTDELVENLQWINRQYNVWEVDDDAPDEAEEYLNTGRV